MKNNESGQSVFEFLFFLPFFLVLYSVANNVGSSIYGSINQQKATRGYFYARVKHNSMVPLATWEDSVHTQWRTFGLFFIGWKEKFAEGGQAPMAACYPIQLDVDVNENACEQYEEPRSQFIRVGTVYGVCGATYQYDSGTSSVYRKGGAALVSYDACHITN